MTFPTTAQIDPLFGTMDDFDAVLRDAHRLGLKVVLDLVPNHTSSEHPWFRSSRVSRTSEWRDWYIWRDPAPDGGPPNNWLRGVRRRRAGSSIRRPAGSVLRLPRVPDRASRTSTGATPRYRAAMHECAALLAAAKVSTASGWMRCGTSSRTNAVARQSAQSGLPRGSTSRSSAASSLHHRSPRRARSHRRPAVRSGCLRRPPVDR